jgi:diguanylate cyclase (GGDEF)-like protein/PAS domain S-box-containing protein
VFGHGFGCDQKIWQYVTPYFENEYRIVLFDYVGSGKSDVAAYQPERYKNYYGYAHDLEEILDALNNGPVIFVGHSASAMIGLLASIKRPELFARLILLGASPSYINEDGYSGGFEKNDVLQLLKIMEMNFVGWASTFSPIFMNTPERPVLAQNLQNSFTAENPIIMRLFAETVFLSDHRQELSKVTVASLIFQCSEDSVVPIEVGQFLHRKLKNSTFYLSDVKGHFPHISEPKETAEIIKQYLNGQPIGSQSMDLKGEWPSCSTSLNQIPGFYFVLGRQGLLKEMNQTFLNMLGYEFGELQGAHIEEVLSNVNKMMLHSLFFPALRMCGKVEELYLIFRAKNGTEIPVLLNANCMSGERDDDIECVAMKITKRIDYEHELQAIKNEESRQRVLFETTLFSIHEGIIVTDREGKITMMNHLAETYTGWTTVEAQGKSFDAVFRCMDLKTRRLEPDIAQSVLQTGLNRDVLDMILIEKDGTERFVAGAVAQMIVSKGDVSGVVTSFRDITKEYLQEKEIEGFLNINLDMLCVTDKSAYFHRINTKFEKVLGYKTKELEGQNYLSYVHSEDMPSTLQALQELANGKTVSGFTNRYRCKDGSYKYLEWQVQSGIGNYTYSSARDVTDQYIKEQRLSNLANRDQLTGQYNRHYLDTIIADQLDIDDLYRDPLALAILDLDYFKRVNDTWGHPVGDELLKLTAQTVARNIRSSDALIRLGGEEFLVLMPQTTAEGAVTAAEKIRVAIAANEHPLTGKQTVSIGVASRLPGELYDDW